MYISQDQTGIGQPASSTSSLTTLSWLRSAAERAIVRYHLSQGVRDIKELTNKVFFFRHPGRQGRRLDPQEPGFAKLAEEWKAIRDHVVRPFLSNTGGSSAQPHTPVQAAPSGSAVLKYHPPTEKRRYGGYSAYGGGRVDQRLKQLRASGALEISDDDIDMLQRIANVESAKQIQGINSYDSAFMSMGFMQWPIAFGKLQRLIARAAPAFRRYGIELDTPRTYTTRMKYGTETSVAIKGAQNPQDLRSREWAERFFAAGMDPEVIVAETSLALEVIEAAKKRIVKKVGSGFLPHYDKSPILRALIQEAYNNRPAYVYSALTQVLRNSDISGKSDTDAFLNSLRKAIVAAYQEREGSEGVKKANRIIVKTASLNP